MKSLFCFLLICTLSSLINILVQTSSVKTPHSVTIIKLLHVLNVVHYSTRIIMSHLMGIQYSVGINMAGRQKT